MACAVPQKCSPRFKTLLRLYLCVPLVAAIGAVFYSAFFLSVGTAVLCGISAALLLIAAIFLPGMYYERMFYTRHNKWLKLERGLFVRTILLVPRGQIICTRLRRGPLERLLGLYTVIMVTSAGNASIPGLLKEDASRLRELVEPDLK